MSSADVPPSDSLSVGNINDASETGKKSKITLYHLNNSRSQRILWLLEELGVPYEIQKYQRTAEYLAPEELKKVHPLGIAPIISDGDTTIAESGAIIEYLITSYGGDRFSPSKDGWLDNLFFTHYAEGTLMPLLVNKLLFTMIPKRTPFFIRPIANMIFGAVMKSFIEPRLKIHHDFIEGHLANSPSGWFAKGDNPTAADFQMYFALEGMSSRSQVVGPKIQSYLSKVHERPAYKSALEKGGEFNVAPVSS